MSNNNESSLVSKQSLNPKVNQPGVEDEEAILRSLYGEPDEDGVFRGEEVSR